MANQRHSLNAIRSLRSEICNDLVVDYVINHLVETLVFTPEEGIEILSSGQSVGVGNDLITRDQILRTESECFIDLLMKKMETIDYAFGHFIYILFRDDNYPWIAKSLLIAKEQSKKIEDLNNNFDEIQTNTEKMAMTEKKVIVCHDVPNKVKNLLQRCEKLNQIRDQLREYGERRSGWLVIHGMSGSGKSILAAEAVRDWNCVHYSDGIWWTNCGLMRKDNKFEESMLLMKMQLFWDNICQHFDEKSQKLECIEMAINKLKNHFKKYPNSLIILDDVWNVEVTKHFNLGVPVVVTTQDKTIIPPQFEHKLIPTIDDNFNVLTSDESRELLALWVNCDPRDLNNEYPNRIIEKLKGNPLYLTLIGSVMEEKGNDTNYWKFFFECIENCSERSTPTRVRNLSGARNNMVYDSFGFNTLVEQSYRALDEKLRQYYKYFSLFLEDIRIPIQVFQIVWDLNKYEVDFIMDQMIKKSLVMILKRDSLTLYMVHDILNNFLKNQCKDELEELHGQLLDRYFDRCRTDDGYNYSLLPNDGYIYYFLGYHIYKSKRFHLFDKIFLDLSFIDNKIRTTGPSDLLNDYFNYREHFEDTSKYADFVRFVSTNADLLCDINIDVFQLTLCQPNDSHVYRNGLDFVSKSNKLYMNWCNQSNVKTSKLLSTKLHSGSVKFAAFIPKEDIIVSVGSDQLVKIWDSNTGKQIRIMKGHEDTINCCQISSNGEKIITASDDGTVKVWNFDLKEINAMEAEYCTKYPHICNDSIPTDEAFKTYSEHKTCNSADNSVEVKCCAFSPNGSLVASGGTDNSVRVWNLNDLKTNHILNSHNYSVICCQFSANSKHLVSASGDEVLVWCLSTDSILKRLKHEMNVENCLLNGCVNNIFTSSGRYIYRRQWSLNDTIDSPKCYNNIKAKDYVTNCSVSPNGTHIAAGTTADQIVLWETNSYAIKNGVTDTWSRAAVATFKCNDKINCINFNSESTKLLSCCEDGTVIIWDTSKTTAASMVALRKHFSVQNQSLGLKVLTSDDTGNVRLFEGIEGKENQILGQRLKELQISSYDMTCCSLASNLDILFGTSDGQLMLYENNTNEIHFLESHQKEVTFCAFIDEQNKFVSASKDKTFRIYGRFSRIYENPKRLVKLTKNGSFCHFKDIDFGPIVSAKIFSRDSKAMIWCENGTLFVIDLEENALIVEIRSEDESQINFADITQSEELIATVGSNKSIRLYRSALADTDLFIRSQTFLLRVVATDDCLRSCRFSPEGDFLVIGDDCGHIKLWDFNGTESRQLQTFQGSHSDWVNDIAIAPNGQLIITISKSIKLWNRNGELLQTFKTNGGSMNRIYTNFVDQSSQSNHPILVTVDDAGVLYILQIFHY